MIIITNLAAIMTMKDLCESERPREKMIQRGPAALSDGELLAVLLRGGTGGKSALDLSRELLGLCSGSLTRLFAITPGKLMTVKGIGACKAAGVLAALELGRRFLEEAPASGNAPLVTARMVYEIMIPLLKGLDHEECWVLFLGDSNYLTGKSRLFSGGGSSTVIDNRMVIREALDRNASGLILVHNHPSLDPRPSRADIAMTDSLRKAASAFGISLLDHVIVSDKRFFSFADDRTYSG